MSDGNPVVQAPAKVSSMMYALAEVSRSLESPHPALKRPNRVILRFRHALALRCVWALLLVTVLIPMSAEAAATAAAGGGIYVPWSRGLREVYGSGGHLSAALGIPFSDHRSRLRLEVGYVTASGHQFRADPTFEVDENEFWIVPISMGLETNANSSTSERAVRVWVGVHGVLALTGWDDPMLGDFDAPAMGGALELRPEVPVHRNLALWLSYRLTALSSVEYQGDSGEFVYSAGTMQAGLAYDWR